MDRFSSGAELAPLSAKHELNRYTVNQPWLPRGRALAKSPTVLNRHGVMPEGRLNQNLKILTTVTYKWLMYLSVKRAFKSIQNRNTLTLEKRRFELCRSAYTWNLRYHTVCGWLNARMQNRVYRGSTLSYSRMFDCSEGQGPNPYIVQGSTVL